ncbi:MAG: TonB-dependent receptor, partial [Sulfurovum sp.]
DVKNHTIATGVDYSLRNWDGGYFKNDVPFPTTRFHSIWDVDTKNIAFFLKDKISLNKIDIDLGLRYDSTEITSANPTQASNDYDALSAYIFGTYLADENTKYFAGFGKSSRVPDGKELYWIGSMGNAVGTPNLEQTTNYEFDMGVEKQFEDASLKAKLFYSKLENYIAYNASDVNDNGTAFHAYENVNAKLYGFELSGTYIVTESLYFDYGVAYQRGKKDTPLEGQIGTNMPDIAPLKANVALNYDYDESLNLRAEVVAASAWNDFDAENGEQKLDAYGVLNLKGIKQFGKNFELTVGVDNLFDKTYAVSNTYKDLVLLPTVGNNEVMLLNEPGRYVYTNLKYMF